MRGCAKTPPLYSQLIVSSVMDGMWYKINGGVLRHCVFSTRRPPPPRTILLPLVINGLIIASPMFQYGLITCTFVKRFIKPALPLCDAVILIVGLVGKLCNSIYNHVFNITINANQYLLFQYRTSFWEVFKPH